MLNKMSSPVQCGYPKPVSLLFSVQTFLSDCFSMVIEFKMLFSCFVSSSPYFFITTAGCGSFLIVGWTKTRKRRLCDEIRNSHGLHYYLDWIVQEERTIIPAYGFVSCHRRRGGFIILNNVHRAENAAQFLRHLHFLHLDVRLLVLFYLFRRLVRFNIGLGYRWWNLLLWHFCRIPSNRVENDFKRIVRERYLKWLKLPRFGKLSFGLLCFRSNRLKFIDEILLRFSFVLSGCGHFVDHFQHFVSWKTKTGFNRQLNRLLMLVWRIMISNYRFLIDPSTPRLVFSVSKAWWIPLAVPVQRQSTTGSRAIVKLVIKWREF